METEHWSMIKEFQGVQLLRDPETMQCRIVPIERQQPQKPEPQIKDKITPEMTQRAEASWAAYCLTRDTGAKSAPSSPEPLKVMGFDEKLKHDWESSLNIKMEFLSFENYKAFMRGMQRHTSATK